jgi:ATP phosphoribosyltransferase regulatory subunit
MSAFMGLPRGSRDLLPSDCRRRRFLTAALLQEFERWGFDEAMTPLVEYYDVLARGLSETDRKALVRFTEAGSGEVVAFRSDLTPQIARMVADRVGDELGPQRVVRLCYAADVVRHARQDRDKTELHQAGVELIGDSQPAIDAELIDLCHATMRAAGLDGFRIDVSHRRVAGDLLDRLSLEPEQREALVGLLARKDRGGVESMLAQRDTEPALAAAVAALCDLYGPPAIMQRAATVLEAAGARSGLERLEAVLAVLEQTSKAAFEAVDVDLGETRGFDYYTGLRLRVWAPGVAEPIVRGGRYDDLLARYGAAAPATGFAVDLDALESALRHAEGRQVQARAESDLPPAHLVAVAPTAATTAGRCEAARWASAAREAGRRAWVLVGLSLADARMQAERKNAQRLTVLEMDESGRLQTSHFVSKGRGWDTVEDSLQHAEEA